MKKKIISAGIKAAVKSYKKATRKDVVKAVRPTRAKAKAAKLVSTAKAKAKAAKLVSKTNAKPKVANVKLTKTQLKQMQDFHKSVKTGVAKRTAKAKATNVVKPRKAAPKKAAPKKTALKAKATNVLKPKANAFKGVQSAGAVKNAPVRAARAARGNKILAGTAGALGAAVVYNKNKSSSRAAASPAAVAPKKKPTNVVTPRKAAPKKAAPKKAAPKKAAPKAKAKPRAASFTPTAKRTPLSVSKGKRKVGYVKSNRSGRGGLRTRGR